MILLQPVGDKVTDAADLEAVGARELHEAVEAGHCAVVAHDLADDGAGIQTGETGDGDRRLGMAGADENAAWARDERKYMAGRDQRIGPVRRVDRNRDG